MKKKKILEGENSRRGRGERKQNEGFRKPKKSKREDDL